MAPPENRPIPEAEVMSLVSSDSHPPKSLRICQRCQRTHHEFFGASQFLNVWLSASKPPNKPKGHAATWSIRSPFTPARGRSATSPRARKKKPMALRAPQTVPQKRPVCFVSAWCATPHIDRTSRHVYEPGRCHPRWKASFGTMHTGNRQSRRHQPRPELGQHHRRYGP